MFQSSAREATFWVLGSSRTLLSAVGGHPKQSANLNLRVVGITMNIRRVHQREKREQQKDSLASEQIEKTEKYNLRVKWVDSFISKGDQDSSSCLLC